MKILVTGKPQWFEKDSHSAISYYRISRPLNELAKQFPSVEVMESAGGTWPEITKADILFLHTPMHSAAIDSIYIAKMEGVKVWLDFDDMIFADDIPKANVAWTFFNGEENKKNLQAAIKAADVISVSTQEIKNRIIEIYQYPAEQIHIIHNAIPDGMWRNRRPFKPDNNNELKRLLWRGSVTHEGDLMLFRNGIKPHKGLGYLFVGHLPWVLHTSYGGHLDEMSYQPWAKPIHRYWQLLRDAEPHYFFVTLERNSFNRGKSNIAWLEATFAGAACIAQSDMPEFANVPTVQFDSVKSLDGVLKNIASGTDLRTEKYMESRALIEKKYLLSVVNRQRMNLIESVL